MKVRVTHLKATAWPDGTKVGDVVELRGDAVPESLVGKCVPLQQEAPAAPPAAAPAPAEPAPPVKTKR